MADKHCGNCKYTGWKGLTRWCRHPYHVAPLENPSGHCNEWLDEDTKHMPGEVPAWEYPVRLAEKNA